MISQNSASVLDPLDRPIKGAKAIAEATGGVMTAAQVWYALEHGQLPGRKQGRNWITTARLLRAHFNGASVSAQVGA